jgi:predicted transcriptional regulator YdeE
VAQPIKSKKMDIQKIEKISVIGVSVRTTNENGQSSQDIPALWNQFMAKDIANKIPNKTDSAVYCIYTDYELDHTKPYTTILGCSVQNLDAIPDGMVGITIDEGSFSKHTAKGNLMGGVVFNEWIKIWNLDIPRAFVTDFEIYGEKAQNPENAEVDIFIGIE